MSDGFVKVSPGAFNRSVDRTAQLEAECTRLQELVARRDNQLARLRDYINSVLAEAAASNRLHEPQD